jgi:hypothetical protein
MIRERAYDSSELVAAKQQNITLPYKLNYEHIR